MAEDFVKHCSVLLLCFVLAAASEITNVTSGDCDPRAAWTVYVDVAAEMIGKARIKTLTSNDTCGKCGQKEALVTYMDVALEMIDKAKVNFPPSGDSCNNQERRIHDCSDLLLKGHRSSGVYTIWPINGLTETRPIRVYCDMETDGGGWTVIQRRGNFKNANDYFFKDWNSYKKGFGRAENELWLGNDNIFSLSSQRLYSARFDMMDANGARKYAHYDTFWIDDENGQYTLHISNYSGDAGDSMTEAHNNQKFSTRDRDNDNDSRNCAQDYKGGWWYNSCVFGGPNNRKGSNLNGLSENGNKDYTGIVWLEWKNTESLAWTEIKIRPMSFDPRENH